MSGPLTHGVIRRRTALGLLGLTAAGLLRRRSAGVEAAQWPDGRDQLGELIERTQFIDTHEHLVEEHARTGWSEPSGLLPCDDWSILFQHYLGDDLQVAGMPQRDYAEFIAPEASTARKWALLEPHWDAVKQTGYGRSVRLAIARLYGIDTIDRDSIPRLAEAYAAHVKPGFYATTLQDLAGIESCQVNSLETQFMESRQPLLLMQDISIVPFSVQSSRGWRGLRNRDGRPATDLAAFHGVITDFFDRYGPYAVAVKSQRAYSRRLDYEDVPAESVEKAFGQLLDGQALPPEQEKALDDHLFWFCVRQATTHRLPVKLHTGYYAGHDRMPLDRVAANPGDVSHLLRLAPETTFVLMHIGYPYQDALIALAKQYQNAVIDMCWAWIVNPVASEQFLLEFLATAPANKLLTFGGDYIPVEPVVGHALLARHGIERALSRLVAEGHATADDALALVEPIMNGNARRLFRLQDKQQTLAHVPWATTVPASDPPAAGGDAGTSH